MDVLPGIRALVAHFDDFLVDLWGVVHDGDRPFAGVIDALEGLARAGDKRVLFVTNTSRSGDAVRDTLARRMGIDRALFLDVVSSGDVTRAALVARDAAVFSALPSTRATRCFHEGDPAFVPWLFDAALGLDMVDDVAVADLVVASGAPRDEAGLDLVRERLAPAVARDVPLVCTNPDRIIPSARGPSLGPGAVARAYADLGGRTFLYGKPNAPIYEAARRALGGASSRRIVAIGDLIETDIVGARAAGFPSVLVGSTSIEAGGPTPDMVIERFAW